MTSNQLVDSRTKHQVNLFGPVSVDRAWQARAAQGFDIACFGVDWDAQIVTCPAGHTSHAWKPPHNQHGQDVIHVEFDRQTCATCPVRAHCTKSKTAGREVTLRPRDYHIALQTARQRQTTAEFKATYAARSGIEGTLSQGIRGCELRQARYRGQTKTHLQNVLIATALNLLRVIVWLMAVPREYTRQSAFARLAPGTAASAFAGWG